MEADSDLVCVCVCVSHACNMCLCVLLCVCIRVIKADRKTSDWRRPYHQRAGPDWPLCSW